MGQGQFYSDRIVRDGRSQFQGPFNAPSSQYRIQDRDYRSVQGAPMDPSVNRPARPGVSRGYQPIIEGPGSDIGRRLDPRSIIVRKFVPPAGQICYPSWASTYFPDCCASYPYYYPSYIDGITVISPYGCYYGFIPPYINCTGAYYQPPVDDYVDPPQTADARPQSTSPDDGAQVAAAPKSASAPTSDNSTQAVTPLPTRTSHDVVYTEPDVQAAVKDLTKAWLDGDDALFSKHLSKSGRIAVYLRGKYQYSLDSADYLDMTRDALRATKTVDFQVVSVSRKEEGIYTVSALHVYQDKKDDSKTVRVSYVLERENSSYVITQVETTPDSANN
jgi:hypothetical protein